MTAVERDLSGRSALVTGAALRLGRTLALGLARAGADVVVHYHRSADQAHEVVAEIEALGRRAVAIAADLEAPGAAESLARSALDAFGVIDLLVNNVGNYLVKPLSDCDGADLRRQLETNLVAPHLLLRALLDRFPSCGGDVVNIGYAGADSLRAERHATVYQISKAGLVLLTRSWAAELAPRRIRVNMVSPGQLENSIDLPPDPAVALPMGRPGRLDEVLDAVLFFLAPDSYVTGQNLDVAGGYRL